MAVTRIFVLAVMFFLVALCPNVGMAVVVVLAGMLIYLTMWFYDIFKGRGKS